MVGLLSLMYESLNLNHVAFDRAMGFINESLEKLKRSAAFCNWLGVYEGHGFDFFNGSESFDIDISVILALNKMDKDFSGWTINFCSFSDDQERMKNSFYCFDSCFASQLMGNKWSFFEEFSDATLQKQWDSNGPVIAYGRFFKNDRNKQLQDFVITLLINCDRALCVMLVIDFELTKESCMALCMLFCKFNFVNQSIKALQTDCKYVLICVDNGKSLWDFDGRQPKQAWALIRDVTRAIGRSRQMKKGFSYVVKHLGKFSRIDVHGKHVRIERFLN
jgi:hypothetical protein